LVRERKLWKQLNLAKGRILWVNYSEAVAVGDAGEVREVFFPSSPPFPSSSMPVGEKSGLGAKG
jgi:hypothetical protein